MKGKNNKEETNLALVFCRVFKEMDLRDVPRSDSKLILGESHSGATCESNYFEIKRK